MRSRSSRASASRGCRSRRMQARRRPRHARRGRPGQFCGALSRGARRCLRGKEGLRIGAQGIPRRARGRCRRLGGSGAARFEDRRSRRRRACATRRHRGKIDNAPYYCHCLPRRACRVLRRTRILIEPAKLATCRRPCASITSGAMTSAAPKVPLRLGLALRWTATACTPRAARATSRPSSLLRAIKFGAPRPRRRFGGATAVGGGPRRRGFERRRRDCARSRNRQGALARACEWRNPFSSPPSARARSWCERPTASCAALRLRTARNCGSRSRPCRGCRCAALRGRRSRVIWRSAASITARSLRSTPLTARCVGNAGGAAARTHGA
jgi:hypothetical protein